MNPPARESQSINPPQERIYQGICLFNRQIFIILAVINQAVRRIKKHTVQSWKTPSIRTGSTDGANSPNSTSPTSPKSATGQLLKWIRVSDKLMHDLEEAGWHPGLKYLTPRQRDYIVGHLGEP